MEIIRIFENNDQGLFSIKYPKEIEDELNRLFELWQDVEYLENFFEIRWI